MFTSINTEMLNKEGFFGLIKRNCQQNKGIKRFKKKQLRTRTNRKQTTGNKN